MLGRYQPWHYGHRKIFEKSLIATGQVLIFVKDVHEIGDNPFSFSQVKNFISKDLVNLAVIQLLIFFMEEKVGYKIKKINLDKDIQKYLIFLKFQLQFQE